jgi:hypothetical protein
MPTLTEPSPGWHIPAVATGAAATIKQKAKIGAKIFLTFLTPFPVNLVI